MPTSTTHPTYTQTIPGSRWPSQKLCLPHSMSMFCLGVLLRKFGNAVTKLTTPYGSQADCAISERTLHETDLNYFSTLPIFSHSLTHYFDYSILCPRTFSCFLTTSLIILILLPTAVCILPCRHSSAIDCGSQSCGRGSYVTDSTEPRYDYCNLC